MVQFVCDNPEIETRLNALYELMKVEGTVLHDSLTIDCKDGSFSVTTSHKFSAPEAVITLAQSCLVPLNKFHFSAKDDEISFEVSDPNVDSLHVDILTLIIEIYNLTDKLYHHRKNSVISLFYEDRALFDTLMEGFFTPVAEQAKELTPQDVFCDNFMNIRGVFFKNMSGSSDEKGANAKFTKYLVPLIDYVNHHPQAFGITGNLSRGYGKGNVKIFATPGINSNGVVTNYGLHDAHSILVHHGYAESNVSLVRSVFMTFDIPNLGSFTISSAVTGLAVMDFPKEIEDLKFYMPTMDIDKKAKNIRLSFLYIPSQNAPQALRRILMLILNQVESSQEKCWEAVLFAESYIIQKNMMYYKKLLETLDGYPSSEDTQLFIESAKQMAKTQINIIESYAFFEDTIDAQVA